MLILFQPVRSLFKWIRSFSTSARSTQVFSTLFVSSVPTLSFFSRLPTLFIQGLRDIQIKYPFIDGKPLHSFPSISLSGDSQEDTKGSFKFIILHSFLLRWIQFKLLVLIISLSSFQMFSHAGAPLNHPLLAIQLFRSAEDIS